MAMEIFKCISDGENDIPIEVIEKIDAKFPNIHNCKEDMASLSQEIKTYKKDSLCRVPFCNTVEGEALGAIIKLGDINTQPRVRKYLIESIDEISNLKPMNFNEGRIAEVLKSVSILSRREETVCLAVQGPFTIANTLMDTRLFYKFLRKEKEEINQFLKFLEDNIVQYIIQGVDRGANIISYADPVGTVDIVGPKIYKDVSGRITYNILKRVENKLKNSVIHLCGKTSTSLESIGFAESSPIQISKDIPYGQVLRDINFKKEDIKFIGNWCIKRSCLNKKDGVLWKINLKSQ